MKNHVQILLMIFIAPLFYDVEAHSCRDKYYKAQFIKSEFVAYGTVQGIKESGKENILEGTFKPIEVFKGQFNKDFKVIGHKERLEFSSKVLTHGEYLIFSTDGVQSYISACGYSGVIEPDLKVKLLDYMRSLGQDPPKELSENRVEDRLTELCIIYESSGQLVCEGNKINIKETLKNFQNRRQKDKEGENAIRSSEGT